MNERIIHGMCAAFWGTTTTAQHMKDPKGASYSCMRAALLWLSENITEDMENCFRCASREEMQRFLREVAK